MSDRIDLPCGGWAQLRNPDTLRHRDERKAKSYISDHTNPALATVDLTDGVIAVAVVAWGDIPYLPNAPLPADELGILGELKMDDYKTLERATEPAFKALFGRALGDTADAADAADPDRPDSPTGPASA